MGGDGKGKGKGDKGGKGGGKGDGYKGDGGKGDGGKGGGGKGGGGKGGKGGKGSVSADIPVRNTGKATKAPAKYVASFEMSEKAPRFAASGASREEAQQARKDVEEALAKIPHPKAGTKGTREEIVTNLVELSFQDNTVIHQYDVKLTPAIRGRKLHAQAVEEALQSVGGVGLGVIVAGDVVFASKDISTAAKDLKWKPTNERLKTLVADTSGVFKVDVELTRQVTTTTISPELVTVFAKLVRGVLDRDESMQKVHRSYFRMEDKRQLPGMPNLEVVPGVNLTLKPVNSGSGLAIQIDVVHKVMSRQTIFDELRLNDKKNWKALEFKVSDTICLTTYDGKDKKKRTVRIDGVEKSMSETTPIPELDNKSLKEYFEKQYGVKVPSGQPVLFHNSLRKQDGQSVAVKEYYLPSVLKLTGIVPEVYGSNVRQRMTEHCAVKPGARFQKIKEMAMTVLKAFKPVAMTWGCTALPGFLKVAGRALPEPQIEQSKGFSKTGKSWRFDIDRRPSNPNPTSGCIEAKRACKKILVVVPEYCRAAWNENSRVLRNSLKHFANGVDVEFKEHEVRAFSKADMVAVAAKYGDKPDIYLIWAEAQNDDAYNAIKHECYKLGTPCQIVRPDSFRGTKNKSVSNNVAAQMHTKVGNLVWKKTGCNHPDTMVVGLASSHAGEGSGRGERKSVMSLACSYNSTLSGYQTASTLMDAGATIARELRHPFMQGVLRYQKENGNKAPKEIVFFREGGSEGEIPLIMSQEVLAVKDALKELKVSAKVTFFLVLRNSHLRAVRIEATLPAQPGKPQVVTVRDAPRLGSVVDTDVVNPLGMEFYLLSQEANIGSPQMIKYKCLAYDGKDIQPDKYQMMANDLACLYFNWQGPIALPAPVMYAQKDAKMAQTSLVRDGVMPPGKEHVGIHSL